MLACIYIFCIYGPRYCHNGFVTHFKLLLDKFKLFFLKIKSSFNLCMKYYPSNICYYNCKYSNHIYFKPPVVIHFGFFNNSIYIFCYRHFFLIIKHCKVKSVCSDRYISVYYIIQFTLKHNPRLAVITFQIYTDIRNIYRIINYLRKHFQNMCPAVNIYIFPSSYSDKFIIYLNRFHLYSV